MLRTSLLTLLLMWTPLALAQDSPPMPRERPEALTAPPAQTEAPATPALPEVPTEEPPAPVAPPEVLEAAPPAPVRAYQTQCPAVIAGKVEASLLPPISEADCGAQSPFAVTGVLVNGRMVPLSGEATLTCEVATNLPVWSEAIDGYLKARENTELAALNVGTSYNCRERVGGSSDRLSEHSFADALDVVGFTLGDGRTITVEGDWPKAEAPEGKFLRFAHDAACSSFSTTLGPEANAEHHDHFHLDMGCHGAACEARLCE